MLNKTNQFGAAKPSKRVRALNSAFLGRLLFILIFVCGAFLPQISVVQLPRWYNSVQNAAAASTSVVISQVYGGGGSSTSATYQNDYVELFNLTGNQIDIGGYSLQYGSAAGNFASFSGNIYTFTTGTKIAPNKYLLVQLGTAGSVGGVYTPDITTTNLNMSYASGKIALVNNGTALGCGSATGTLCSLPDSRIVDLVSYGAANDAEGGASANNGTALTSIQGAVRKNNGCQDSDNNNNDFDIVTNPVPRNSSAAANICSSNQPIVPTCASPISTNQGSVASEVISATDSDGTVNQASLTNIVPAPVTGTISLGTVFPAMSNGSTLTTTLNIDNNVPVGTYVATVTFTNTDSPTAQNASCDVTVNVNSTTVVTTPIYQIQSSSRQSAYTGQVVTTTGVVVGLKSNGFFMQDPVSHYITASDGIFVFTGSAPTVPINHSVQVSGKVSEYRSSKNYQPLTEIGSSPTVTDQGITSPITPTVLTIDPSRLQSGNNYIRLIPTNIYASNSYNSTTAGYDIANNSVDFFESLEGMLVEVDNARVVGPSNSYNEFAVVPDNGTGLNFNSRGALPISANQLNSRRIQIGKDSLGYPGNPIVKVGDNISSPIKGALDSQFGNWFIQPNSTINYSSGTLPRDVVSNVTNPNQLRIVDYNIENFSSVSASDARVMTLTNHIVNYLGLPDLLVLEEIQDDSGPTDDGTVVADTNLSHIRDAVFASSGISYTWRYINPVNDQEGGQPGGNIRVVFFFRTDRGLSFVDKPGGGPTIADSVNTDGSLAQSPGRIDPTNSAFDKSYPTTTVTNSLGITGTSSSSDSRKPLAGEFQFKGQRLIVIGNHWTSKGGDVPIYGDPQPALLLSEPQRVKQAAVNRDFVTQIMNANPDANVIVAGDLNAFEFEPELITLKTGGNGTTLPVGPSQVLTDVVESSTSSIAKYSYIFEGNAQSIDHILYNKGLASKIVAGSGQAVHINSDYSDKDSLRLSDHEPETVVLDFTPAPAPPVSNTYTYYLPFLANNYVPAGSSGSFTSYLAFQNAGNAAANIKVSYFDSTGITITAASIITTVAQYGEILPANPIASGARGAGVVTSDQPLNVIVAEATPFGGSAYAVSQGASPSLIAPLAINNSGGFITQLTVFNGDVVTTTATINFYDSTGASPAGSAQNITIGPRQAVTLDQTAISGSNPSHLPAGFYGWARITGVSGSTLVAQVLEQRPDIRFVAIANAQAAPKTTLYAPAIFNNAYGGFVTGANIVNPNSSPVTVYVTYYNLSGTATANAPVTIGANGVLPLYQGAGGGSGLVDGFAGAAVITSTGSGVVVVVNENNTRVTSGSQSGTYSAATGGNSQVGLPVIANGGFGYTTGTTVFNASNTVVSFSLTYYGLDGKAISGIPSTSYSLNPYASVGIYQGGVAGLNYGTAVLTQTGGAPNALIDTTNALNATANLFYTYTEPNQ